EEGVADLDDRVASPVPRRGAQPDAGGGLGAVRVLVDPALERRDDLRRNAALLPPGPRFRDRFRRREHALVRPRRLEVVRPGAGEEATAVIPVEVRRDQDVRLDLDRLLARAGPDGKQRPRARVDEHRQAVSAQDDDVRRRVQRLGKGAGRAHVLPLDGDHADLDERNLPATGLHAEDATPICLNRLVAALYRKYRPQTFDDVVGQDPVVRTLRNAIANGQLRQAYLFAGPRGTGKTSMARILAKSVNCAQGPTTTPDNTCHACAAISNGTSLDVVEMDAASQRGIDDIREIRERVVLQPVEGRYKVYILDEAHQLTDAAWNALLKLIEEPPPHLVFVFCTTDLAKVLPTVRSRCQTFVFSWPRLPDLVRLL